MEGTDCLECRVASGGGLILASIYLYCQASNKTKFNKTGILFVSAGKSLIKYEVIVKGSHNSFSGLGAVGFARLLNLYPFNSTKS